MIWVNDRVVQIDINFLIFILCCATIVFVLGLAIGIEAGRKLDHRLLKKNYFKIWVPNKELIK